MSHQLHIIKERNEYSIQQETGWRVDYGYKGLCWSIKRDDHSLICEFPAGLRPEQKQLAQLISATPDLLEALYEVVNLFDINELDDDKVSIIQNAWKAIDKATTV
jgi:hypothetical protein